MNNQQQNSIEAFKKQLNDAYGRLMDASARNNNDDFTDALQRVDQVLRFASKKLTLKEYEELSSYSEMIKKKLKDKKIF